MENSKIIKLTAENIKRIQAVEITPSGDLVIIGGRNGQGKTSVLDSIMYALGGRDTMPSMPVRFGQERGLIEVDLGDLIVRRTVLQNGGGSLSVSAKDGTPQKSPQAILDALVGKMAFDPLEFSRLKQADQSATLRALAGLDFTKDDADKAALFNERTNVNRNLQSAKARVASMQRFDGVGASEQSSESVLMEQSEAISFNALNAEKRNQLERGEAFVTSRNAEIQANKDAQEDCDRQIQEVQSRIAALKTASKALLEKRNQAAEKVLSLKSECAKLADRDISGFSTKLREVESTNQKVRANLAHAEADKLVKETTSKANELTKKIEAIDRKKDNAVKSAKFPVEGLGFTSNGSVAFNGIPLDQASSAEQLRVSVAIGLALNPKLRVLLIRDGSLLDSESMALVAKSAKAANAQIWVERVGTDGNTAVVIEDGLVQEQPKSELESK